MSCSATVKSLRDDKDVIQQLNLKNASSRDRAEPVAIWKARKFIEEHSGEELSLTRVAKAVNMNANYLSERFQAGNWHELCRVTSRALDFKKRADLLHNGRSAHQ